MTAKPYPQGTFSWIDLSTTDGAAGKAFYSAVFGWELVDSPLPGGGVYTMCQQNGKDVCGMSQMSPEQQAQGMPPTWNSYISVDDVAEMTKKAADLGATVIAEPFPVMEAGKMSVIQDPTGAFVSLWEAVNHRGAGIFNHPFTHGWNELATREPNKAADFYTALLGWKHSTDDTGYGFFQVGDRANGGMMQMDENWPAEVPSHWSVYFSVADIDASCAAIKEHGGNVEMGPFDAGETGRIAIVTDPQGTRFSIIQMSQFDADLPGE